MVFLIFSLMSHSGFCSARHALTTALCCLAALAVPEVAAAKEKTKAVYLPTPIVGKPPATVQADKDAPVDFHSDALTYDDVGQSVTAAGHVEISQNGQKLTADQVTYSMAKDAVTAQGNVVLTEPNGDTHYADQLDLQDNLKNGYVKKLHSILADGSRFTASEGFRRGGTHTEMKDATYTPCIPCRQHPEETPLWQIKADKVIHDEVDHSIVYKNATFDFEGVPVAYVPYFTHPDGTITQKSGFLAPTFSLSSRQGFGVEPRYYWAIDPSRDALIQ